MATIYRDCPQILREFLSYHETIKGQSKKTIAEYRLDLRMFLRYLKLIRSDMSYQTDLQTISIQDIDLSFIGSVGINDVYDFLAYLADVRHIGPAGRARKLSAIKSFYKYLTVRTRQLPENPVQDLEFPRLRKSLPRYLTLEQAQTLLQAVKGPNAIRDYAILMIFLSCGVRISELVGLNLPDIRDDRIRVIGKGNKERIVYMGQACQEAVVDYIQNERSKIYAADENALFISRDHNRMSISAVHRLVKKHLLAAGLDASLFSAHKLRHTAATLMLSGGVDLRTLQELLGHEHLNTTEIYTHIENTELKIAAEANPISKIKKD